MYIYIYYIILYYIILYIYILHCKYKVKPHGSPWFSAGCAAALVDRNQFFLFVPTK